MSESIQQILARALLTLLKPMVRILLRNGIAYGSFAELVKKTYVDVAFDDFAPSGKKQTISHVSALTGLTRKEAKRLHELEQSDPDGSEQRYNRAVRVISGWLNDPDFHDANGKASSLPIEGDKGSFAALVRKYSGDVPTQSMLAVLTTASRVKKEGDRVHLIRHAYVPGRDPADKLHILGTDTAELVATIDHNLFAGDKDLRFQRKVSNHHVKKEAVPLFRNIASEKSQALLEELDAWLSEHEVEEGDDDSSQGQYVSLGIYFYESNKKKEDPS